MSQLVANSVKTMCLRSVLAFLICLSLLLAGVSSSEAQSSPLAGQVGVGLSPEEQSWLAAHAKIRIANEMDWPPFSFVEDGKAVGYGTDYLKLVAAKVGVDIDWVTGHAWKDLLRLTKEGEIDVIHSLSKTAEREEYLNYTPAYHTSFKVIITRPEDSTIQSLKDFEGRSLAVIDGFSLETELKEDFPLIKQVKVASALDGLLAVSLGKADAFIGRQAVCQYYIKNFRISNVAFATVDKRFDEGAANLFIGVRKSWPELATILEKGMKAISAEELNALESRWFGTGEESKISLTSAETDWIRQNPVVRVAATPDWPPFEFEENGKHVGVAVDILQTAADLAGLKLAPEFNNWTSVMSKVKSGELDLSPGMVKTVERTKDYLFTEPYSISQVGIWVQTSRQDIHAMDDLLGKTVALEKGYYTQDQVEALYPGIKLHLVEAPIDAVLAVSSGQVDAYLGAQSSTAYLRAKNMITNLKLVGYFKEAGLELSMGVNKDKQILVDIINKGLRTLTATDKMNLLAKYVSNVNPVADARKTVRLTAEEKEWIADHKNIRLGVDSSWPPFEYFMGTTASGLSAEYVKLLAKDTGLSFAPPPILNWADVVRLSQEKELDVLPAVTPTPVIKRHLSFSKPYGSFPIAIYQQAAARPLEGMEGLDGKSVAVVTGYAITEFLKDNHSDIKLVEFTSLDKATKALSDGQVDALAGNMVAVEYAKQQLSIFNVVPAIKTPYTQELRFGVRQDWEPLVRIIDKWLATIDQATHESMAQVANVNLDISLVEEGVEESLDYAQLLLIGAGIIFAFGISLVIMIFLRRIAQNRAERLYSSHQYKVVGIIISILFLCLVVVGTWYTLSQLQDKARQGAGEALESILLTTHESLSIWEKQNKLYMKELVENPILRSLTRGLISFPEDLGAIEASPQLWNIRKFMQKAQASRGFVEFSIISKNSLNYATSDNEDLLDKNLISIQRPRLLDNAFLGNMLFVPPIKVTSDHAGTHGAGELSFVAIAAPIKDEGGKVLAVLILYYDASDVYKRIIALGRLGLTGQTYTFDKYGNLASESRFEEQLHALGLIDEQQNGILNLHLADPGGNLVDGYTMNSDDILPLTVGVESAIAGKSGRDLDGYRDYRGVQVLGAWLWDDNLGLGLVTEMDVDEALGSYRLVRNTVITIILITILLGTIMTGLSNWIGQSAAKSLSKAKDELEDRVEERTAELKKISVAVEKSPTSVVITDSKGVIEYVNPTFTTITGYSVEEAIGLNPKVLKSGVHPIEFYQEMWGTILQGSVWNGDILNTKKNGELFWERTSIAPIFDDENILTNFVAVKEDITARKAQEERFQALLDAAPDAMVIIARSGDITLVNLATEELFGYDRSELIGHKVEKLLPDYIRKDHPQYRDKFFATPEDLSLVAAKSFYGQTKAGDQVPVDISLNPIETEDGLQIIASIRDITERKKAEAAIAKSEERTRLILACAGEGIFGVNLKGEVTFINDMACKMVGYTSDELMGKGVHEIIHHSRPDGSFYPVEECPMRNAFVEGVSSRVDDEVLWRKDGTSFPVEYAAMPVMRGGEKIGAVISFQDVTKRKEVEEEILMARQEFEDIFDNSEMGIMLLSGERVIARANERLSELLKYDSPEDMIGLSTRAIYVSDESYEEMGNRYYAPLAEGGRVHTEYEMGCKDGTSLWCSVSARAFDRTIPPDLSKGVLWCFDDISKRKALEVDLIKANVKAEDALAVVTSSIHYASRIQRSVLPPDGYVDKFTADHFVVWEPRDVVGGDLYWSASWGRGHFIMLGDCTGHGVPGAFMTLLSTGALERSLLEVPPGDSARLISRMHQMIQAQLGQNSDANGDAGSDDGLELGICYVHPKKKHIVFAGARMPLFIDNGESIEVLKSDKKGIGYRGIPFDFEYNNNEIEVADGMTFFMTTDGIIDQIGGEKKRGFGKKRFITLLESLRGIPLQNQGEIIYQNLLTYQGKEKRRDDVSIVGFKL